MIFLSAAPEPGLLRNLAIEVDVQMEALPSTAGIKLERWSGAAEFKLIEALFAEFATHFFNTVRRR